MFNSFIIDGAVDENNKVIFFESGRSLMAGFKGNGLNMGDLWYSLILQHAKETYYDKIWRFGETKATFTARRFYQMDALPEQELKNTKKPKKSLIVVPRILQENYHYLKTNYPEFDIMDASPVYTAWANNKAVFGGFMGKFMDHMPYQRFYLKQPFAKLVDQILADFKDYDDIVFKSPEANKGERVFMVKKSLLKRPELLFSKYPELSNYFSTEDDGYDKNDRYSAGFIIQQAVIPKIMRFEEAKKQPYRPTLRMVFSSYMNDKKKYKVKFMFGYWKLPRKPDDGGDISSEKVLSTISIVSKIPGAVSSAMFRHEDIALGNQIAKEFEKSQTEIAKCTVDDMVLTLLQSDQVGLQATAARVLASPVYNWVENDKKIEEIRDRVTNLIDQYPEIRKYLTRVRNQSRPSTLAKPAFTKIIDPVLNNKITSAL